MQQDQDRLCLFLTEKKAADLFENLSCYKPYVLLYLFLLFLSHVDDFKVHFIFCNKLEILCLSHFVAISCSSAVVAYYCCTAYLNLYDKFNVKMLFRGYFVLFTHLSTYTSRDGLTAENEDLGGNRTKCDYLQHPLHL